MSCCYESKTFKGLVRVRPEDAQSAAKRYLAILDDKIEKQKEKLVQKRIEKARKGCSFFGLFYIDKPQEVTREQAEGFLERESKRTSSCTEWDRAKQHSWRDRKRKTDAENVLGSSKKAASSLMINIEVWGWLSEYAEDNTPATNET